MIRKCGRLTHLQSNLDGRKHTAEGKRLDIGWAAKLTGRKDRTDDDLLATSIRCCVRILGWVSQTTCEG